MKFNGKEVIEIRPMTRLEYGRKYNVWGTMRACEFCFYDRKVKPTIEAAQGCVKTVCSKQPAYINGAFRMIVRISTGDTNPI